MDISLCATCILFFQNALKSPIGEVVTSYLSLFDSPLYDEYNILTAYEKLRRNEYSSPEELLDHISKIINHAIRFFGADSEISISLLAIKQKINFSAKHLLKGNNEIYQQSKNKLITSLVSISKTIPNNENSFKEFVNPDNIVHGKPFIEPYKPSLLTIQTEKIDPNELKVLIQTLPKDEDNQYVKNIISHYEPEYAKSTGTVQIELKDLQPYTLRKINEYAVKHAPPIPKPTLSSLNSPRKLLCSTTGSTSQHKVNPASIPRMKSTPLPISPDSKGILKTDLKSLHQSSSKIASQNLHQSLQAAATPQDLAKTLSLLTQNPKNSPLQVVTALTAISKLAMFKNAFANQQAAAAQKEMKQPQSAPSTPTISSIKSKASSVPKAESKDQLASLSNNESHTKSPKKNKEKTETKKET